MQNRPTTWNGVEVPYGASVDHLATLVGGSTPERWAAFVALAHMPGESALAIRAESVRSWTVSFPLRQDPSYYLFEYACHEGNSVNMRAMLSAARLADR
jgi:hypothetical protein